MKRKITLFITSVLLLAGVTSCNNWLDVEQDTEKKAGEMFDDYNGFKGALAGCYADLAGANLYGMALTMSHVDALAGLWYIDNTRSGLSQTLLECNAFNEHNYGNNYAETAVKNIYGAFYNVILQANLIIEGCRDKGGYIEGEQARVLVEGEAYAIRALCQFDLLRLFGQLPAGATRTIELPYSFTTSLEEVPAYYGWEDYVALLQNDLDRALTLMKDKDPLFEYTYRELNTLAAAGNGLDIKDDFLTNRRIRMNYWAVKALQARFYLYIGENEKAREVALEVIDAKTVGGEPVVALSSQEDYGNEGGTKYNSESECLFGVWMQDLPGVSVPLLAGGPAVGSPVDLNSVLVLTSALYGSCFEGAQTATDIRYSKLWSQTRQMNGSTVYPSIRKYYINKENENSDVQGVIPVLRLSEMYLIVVETAENVAEANRIYMEYMESKNVRLHDPFVSLEDIKPELTREYRREFFAEGQLFYFYKRHQEKKLWSKAGRDMTEDDYSLRLPNTEFNPAK